MSESDTPNISGSIRTFDRSLPMSLLKARESIMTHFRPMLREHGLTEQQWRVLRAMAAVTRPLRPTEISQMTFLSTPSLSRLLKTLESKAIINRGIFAADLRGAEFELTPKGVELVQLIAPNSEKKYQEIENAVGQIEIENLYKILDIIVKNLGEPLVPESE